MKFNVLTLFPELIQAGVSSGVLSQGIKKGLLDVQTLQLRDFATDAHRHVDDRPFGGGDGMILMPEILEAALKQVPPGRVIYLSPQGARLTDAKVRALALEPQLTLVCGRYGGVDQRALNELVDEEISIGDYVLSGGELPALVLIDAVARQLPGVLGHEASAQEDSFAGGLLEHPHFTRPRDWKGMVVPEVLLSGNHSRIALWKQRLSQLVTLKKRPDLLADLSVSERNEIRSFWETLSPQEKAVCGLEDLDLQS